MGNGVPLPIARKGPAWKARHRISGKEKSDICAWLFLAPPWVSFRPHTEIQSRLLDPKAHGKQGKRCRKAGCLAETGLGCLNCMGMRDKRSVQLVRPTTEVLEYPIIVAHLPRRFLYTPPAWLPRKILLFALSLVHTPYLKKHRCA